MENKVYKERLEGRGHGFKSRHWLFYNQGVTKYIGLLFLLLEHQSEHQINFPQVYHLNKS